MALYPRTTQPGLLAAGPRRATHPAKRAATAPDFPAAVHDLARHSASVHIPMTRCSRTEIKTAHRSGDADVRPRSLQAGATAQEASGVAQAGTGGMARCGSVRGGWSLSDTPRAAVRHLHGDARTPGISLVADIDVRRSSPRVPRKLSVSTLRQIDTAQISVDDETGNIREVHSAPLDARHTQSGRG